MIWFDNTRMFKSVSYYVQQMYAQNKGTNVLKLTMDKKPVAGQEGQDGLFASAVWDGDTREVVVKVVNTSSESQQLTLALKGIKNATAATTLTLSYGEMDAENTLDQPEKIVPKAGTATVAAGKKAATLTDRLPAKTFRLYRIKNN
jgi:alpha-L-arabinofuranosidase